MAQHSEMAMILHAYVRGLSDDDMHDITAMRSPTVNATVRGALHAFITDSPIDLTDGKHLLNEFFTQCDMTQTRKPTLLGVQDARFYRECFTDVVESTPALAKAALMYITQIFNVNDVYVGSWITCFVEDEFKWILVTDDWNTEIVNTAGEAHAWAYDLADPHAYIVYGSGTKGWPQIYAGARYSDQLSDKMIEAQMKDAEEVWED